MTSVKKRKNEANITPFFFILTLVFCTLSTFGIDFTHYLQILLYELQAVEYPAAQAQS